MARIIKPPLFCDRLIEACRYEYKTRHLIDGRIVQCDQRISIVAGYLTEEISGLSPFTFIHKDDVRWVMVALRQSKFTQTVNYLVNRLSIRPTFSVRLWKTLRRIVLSTHVTHRSIHLFENSRMSRGWWENATSALVRLCELSGVGWGGTPTDKRDEEEVLGNNQRSWTKCNGKWCTCCGESTETRACHSQPDNKFKQRSFVWRWQHLNDKWLDWGWWRKTSEEPAASNYRAQDKHHQALDLQRSWCYQQESER